MISTDKPMIQSTHLTHDLSKIEDHFIARRNRQFEMTLLVCRKEAREERARGKILQIECTPFADNQHRGLVIDCYLHAGVFSGDPFAAFEEEEASLKRTKFRNAKLCETSTAERSGDVLCGFEDVVL